jgi:hypothetical protein
MKIALLVPVAAKGRDDVVAVLDVEDFERLGGRKLSLGSHGYAQMRDDKCVILTTGLFCRDTPVGEPPAGVLARHCRQLDGTTRVVDLLAEAPPTSLMVTVTT